MHLVFGILIFVVVAAVSVMLVGGWLTFIILRGIVRAVAGPRKRGVYDVRFSHRPRPSAANTVAAVLCPRPGCHDSNPVEARFCRRCGAQIPGSAAMTFRKVA